MRNKRKHQKRLSKAITRRTKQMQKERLEKAWRNIFVKAGILKPQEENS